VPLKLLRILLVAPVAFACSTKAPPEQSRPVWEVSVAEVRPNGAKGAALLTCSSTGGECAELAKGQRLGAGRVLKARGATAELELAPRDSLRLADGAEIALTDAEAPTVELRRGAIQIQRQGAGERLRLSIVDRPVDVETPSIVTARTTSAERAEISVSRGRVVLGGAGEALELRAGQAAAIAKGAPPDARAAYAGRVAPPETAFIGEAAERTASPDARGFGSMTARVPGQPAVVSGVRLVSHRVRAVVRDGFARTEIEEVFQNDSDRVLEGRYVFPIPADATISRLALWVGDKLVEGEVVERKRAAAIFTGIVEDTVRPRDPALLEWVSGSKFSLKIFPIPAKGSRKVLLAYNQALPEQGARARYVYPLSLGAERATRIDDFSISVTLADTVSKLTDVSTPGYAADVRTEERRASVSYAARTFVPEKDFVVGYERVEPADLQLSAYVPKWGEFKADGLEGAAAQAAEDPGFVAMRVRAELPQDAPVPAFQRRDRILVVDTSHSQSKQTLAGEMRLAVGILRQMDPDERFAVLACDSACESSPPSGLVAATEASVVEAERWLAQRAPSGSSDLAGALIDAARRVDPGAAAQIVYVGDGAPSAGELSADAIARRVKPAFEKRSVDLRLLGAGPSVDEVVLAALSRSLRATYDRVTTGEALAERIARIATDLRRPVVSGPKLELPPAFSDVYPRALPNLRLGQEIVVVAKLAAAEPGQMKLTGELAGKPYSVVRPIAWSARAERQNPLVPRLWAEARIGDLQAAGDAGTVKDVVALAKRFHVMSRHTSLLVLENEQMFAEFGIRRTALDPSAHSDHGFGIDAAPGTKGAGGAPAKLAAGFAGDTDALDTATLGAIARSDVDRAAGPPAAATPGGGGLAGIGGSSRGSSSGAFPSEPRGSASVGSPALSGGAPANAARVIAGMRAGFRACFQRGLAQDPSIQGSVRLTLRIGAGGEVLSATPAASGNLPGSVVGCIAGRARGAAFDPPEGGTATIVVPITFASEPGSASRPSADPLSQGGWPGRGWRMPTDTAVHRDGDDKWMVQGDEAIEKLRAAVQGSNESRKKHEALVRGLLVRGRFAEALTAAKRFTELDPDLALARELLAYAAVATGDKKLASSAVATLVENAPATLKVQVRAARAFEAFGDERRACAHWRSIAELQPKADEALYESFRCRARVLDDRDGALAAARAVEKPGKRVQGLIPLLETSKPPAFETATGSPGQFEAILNCIGDCPIVIVITPTGTVFSAWTPALARSSPKSFAFSGLMTGTYRTLLVGGARDARGEVELRALGATKKIPFTSGAVRTVAATTVTVHEGLRFAGFGGGL
jgi:hypothetical protein